MNKANHQPHYPCADAVSDIQMKKEPFENEEIKVFWADSPQGDFLVDPGSFFDGPSRYANYGAPLTWPKKDSPLRLPRAVLFGSNGNAGVDPITTENERWQSFVLQMKQMVESISPSLFFQWSGIGGIFTPLLPFDYTDPANCFLLAECLIFCVPNVFDSIFASAELWNDYFNQIPDHDALFPRIKVILLPTTDRNYYLDRLGGDPESEAGFQLNAGQYRTVLEQAASGGGSYSLPTTYTVGPDFNNNLGYMESTIREFWSL